MLSLSSEAPILFLPFRIETRFSRSAAGEPQLWVLVVPDQISLDTHEPQLTPAEMDAGMAYWDALWRLGTDPAADQRPPWRVLAQAYGPQRAAWIARRLTPTNLAERPVSPTAPGLNPSSPLTFPVLGAGDKRASSWSRAPLGVALPTQWNVVLYVGADPRYTASGALIDSRLALGPTPNAPSLNADPRDLQIDEGMHWTVDFAKAVDVGMGIAVDISAEDAAEGFDRVIVYGACAPPIAPAPLGPRPLATSVTHGTTLDVPNEAVARLIDTHHYTDGFAFAPQGMAANNTKDTQLGYTRTDPGFDRSFRVERSGPLAPGDAGRFTTIVGIDPQVFSHIEHADGHEQENAKWMAVALWPATMGYVLRQLFGDEVSAEQEEEARVYFRDTVRGRGPLPAIRVGDTPYGVLPVTSLQDFKPFRASTVTQQLVTFLKRMQPVWLRSAANAPRITRDGDPDKELLEVLGMDASSQSYRARHGLLDHVVINTMRFLRLGAEDEWLDESRKPGREALDRFEYQGLDPQIIHVLLSKKSFEIPYPIVQDEPLSETEPLTTFTANGVSGNYISWLRTATVDDIREERYPVGAAPTSLLYKVLRQSLLREYANSAFDVQIAAGIVSAEAAREPIYVGFESRPVTTAWQALDAQVPRERKAIPAKAFLYGLTAEQTAAGTPFARLGELRSALDRLAELPTSELERLFTETLDCFSHRLDPWITSLATKSLSERRAAGVAMTYLGGYGWVEDLRPEAAAKTVSGEELASVNDLDLSRTARTIVGASRAAVREPAKNTGGFICAPSLGQAAAGAVLRQGYLSHRGTSNGKLLALDLSSDRVRIALSFIDGVRQGQPLGALLGYRFEAAMHAKGLDGYIDGFRARFPVVANKMTQPGDTAPAIGPVEAVAAPNVTDGLALHDKWADDSSIWGDDVPATGDDTVVDAILRALDDALDALGDVSAAEGVYQVLRGNYTRAGGLMDALSRGEYAPDPEILASPRTGTDVIHRVVLLATGVPQASANWPAPVPAHPRATAEPRVDAWLGTLLPDPQLVRCRVTAKFGNAAQTVSVTLAALELTPLDLLSLADATGDAQQSELELRIAYAASKALPPDPTDVAIVLGAADLALGPNERSFPDLIVLLRAARDLLGGARPLAPQDLVEPDRRTGVTDDTIDAQELETRAGAAVNGLKAALDDLTQKRDAARNANPIASPAQLTALRTSLLAASLYDVPGAIPASATQVADVTKPEYVGVASALIDQANTVLEATTKRHEATLDARAAWDMAEQRKTVRRDRAIGLAQTVLGKGFVVLPTFQLAIADAQAFDAARTNASALLGTDALAVERWVQQLTHVRAGVARYDLLSMTAQLVTGIAPLELIIVQLPTVNGARWLALKPQPGDPDPTPGAVSIATYMITGYDATRPHAGMVFDDWVERIPSSSSMSAISFYFNRPNNHAPNALLLAVAPSLDAETWSPDLVLRILNETLDLTRIRAVDLDSITDVGQVLPALYFPFNPDGQTVSVEVVEIN
jgi:hypothetical protein